MEKQRQPQLELVGFWLEDLEGIGRDVGEDVGDAESENPKIKWQSYQPLANPGVPLWSLHCPHNKQEPGQTDAQCR